MKIDKESYETISIKRANGMSVAQLAKEYGVKENCIYRILEKYELEKNETISNYKINLEKERVKVKITSMARRAGIHIIIDDNSNEKEKLTSEIKEINDTQVNLLNEKQKEIEALKAEIDNLKITFMSPKPAKPAKPVKPVKPAKPAKPVKRITKKSSK